MKKKTARGELKSQWEKLGNGEKSFPPCTHSGKDCINRDVSGNCRALANTAFNRECPFYRCWRDVSVTDLHHFMHNEQALNHYRLMRAMLYANLDTAHAATPPVKAFRIRTGYSQGQAAEYLDISRGTYGEKEKDPRGFTLGEAYRLARLFGVSVYDLFPEEASEKWAKK